MTYVFLTHGTHITHNCGTLSRRGVGISSAKISQLSNCIAHNPSCNAQHTRAVPESSSSSSSSSQSKRRSRLVSCLSYSTQVRGPVIRESNTAGSEIRCKGFTFPFHRHSAQCSHPRSRVRSGALLTGRSPKSRHASLAAERRGRASRRATRRWPRRRGRSSRAACPSRHTRTRRRRWPRRCPARPAPPK